MSAFDSLFRDADRLFEGALAPPPTWSGRFRVPPADLRETVDELTLTMDLPGYDPKSLDVRIEGDVLTVRAQRALPNVEGTWLRQERAHGEIARSFVLPDSVDTAKCEARCEHGVLTVRLAKREESKPRSIAVSVSS
jgi:HSP20 family protein